MSERPLADPTAMTFIFRVEAGEHSIPFKFHGYAEAWEFWLAHPFARLVMGPAHPVRAVTRAGILAEKAAYRALADSLIAEVEAARLAEPYPAEATIRTLAAAREMASRAMF